MTDKTEADIFAGNYSTMVKLVDSRHKKSAGRDNRMKWLWIAGVVLLAVLSSVLVMSVCLHTGEPDCRCFFCVMNASSGESELTYNRYLPLVSGLWAAILLVLFYALVRWWNRRSGR